jgi:hypothetical protein
LHGKKVSLFLFTEISANLISCGKIYGKHFVRWDIFASMSEEGAGESVMAYFMSTAERQWFMA